MAMPGECGRFALRDTLSTGFLGSITVRSRCTLIGSGQRDAFDLDLAAATELHAAGRAGRRILRKELPERGVHGLELQHAVDEDIDLHDVLQRRACGLEHVRHVREDLPRLACNRACEALAGL